MISQENIKNKENVILEKITRPLPFINFPTSSILPTTSNVKNNFDPAKAVVAKSNMEIDRVLVLQDIPDPIAIVDTPWSEKFPFWVSKTQSGSGSTNIGFMARVKPVACFQHYLGTKVSPGTIEHKLRKLKGSTTTTKFGVEATASASAGFFGCEASLSVTTSFSYESIVKEEVEETWTETLYEGKYIINQNVIVYAFQVMSEFIGHLDYFSQLSGIKFYERGGGAFFFFPVFRNDPYTLRFNDAMYNTFSKQQVIDYLMGDGYPRW